MPTETGGYEGLPELEVLEHATRYATRIAEHFADALPPDVASPSVADFGAGIGTITRAFGRTTRVRPTAIERDDGLRARLVADGFHAVREIDDVGAGSLDLVFSSNVLEHIDDDVGALRLLRSRLRPGGRLALWVPAFPILWTTLDDRVGHVRRYTRPSLEAAVRAAGFRVIRSSYRDSLGFAAALVYRIVRRGAGSLDPRSVRLYDRWLFPTSDAIDSTFAPPFGKNVFLLAEAP